MESGFLQVFLQFPFVSLNDLSSFLCHIVRGEGQREASGAGFGFPLPQWGHTFGLLSFTQLLVFKTT